MEDKIIPQILVVVSIFTVFYLIIIATGVLIK